MNPVAHIDTYPPATLDATTLRNVRRIAHENVSELDRIRAELVEQDNKVGLEAWDDAMGDDTAKLNDCIERIDAELKTRGLPL